MPSQRFKATGIKCALQSEWRDTSRKLSCNTCVSLEILMKKFMCLFQIRVMLYFPGIMISNMRWSAFFFTLYRTPGFSPEIAKVSSLSMIVRFWKKIYLQVTIYQQVTRYLPFWSSDAVILQQENSIFWLSNSLWSKCQNFLASYIDKILGVWNTTWELKETQTNNYGISY